MLAVKVVAVFLLFFPACIIDGLLYILGGWTLPDYERPSAVYKLVNWLEK